MYLNLGIAHRHLKTFERSKLFLTNSTVYWQSIGSTAQLANTLDELGLTHIAAGEYTKAKECFDSALHELNMGKVTLELQRIHQRVDTHVAELQALCLRISD